MSLFIDKNHRRKSPIVLAGFFAALLYVCIYGVLYALLAGPLYHHLQLPGTLLTNIVHTLIVSLIGTAICGLLFLMKDKRVALLGFAGLAVVLAMFYIAAFMLENEERALMLQIITLYGLAPAIIGNLFAWPVYRKLRKTHPLPERKTLREEIREAAGPDAIKPVTEETRSDTRAPRRSAEEDAMMLFGSEDDDE